MYFITHTLPGEHPDAEAEDEDEHSRDAANDRLHGDTEEAVRSAALEAAHSSTRGGGGAPVGQPLPELAMSAAQSRQARPEEARAPSWGAAKGAAL
eukprot:scaffold115875_cov27-Phaeocystis_antarctica.AAC.2